MKIKLKRNKPRFVMVELNQLERFFNLAQNVEKLPGGPKKGKPRSINWTRNG
jgi:hypothetical protein